MPSSSVTPDAAIKSYTQCMLVHAPVAACQPTSMGCRRGVIDNIPATFAVARAARCHCANVAAGQSTPTRRLLRVIGNLTTTWPCGC